MRTLLKKHFTLLLFFLPVFSFGQFIANYHKAYEPDIIAPFYYSSIKDPSVLAINNSSVEIAGTVTLHFGLNKYSFTPEMKKTLDTLIDILNKNPETHLEVSAHSDSRGSADYNLALTQKRSKSISQYLVLMGISHERFFLKNFGEIAQLIRCDDTIVCTQAMQKENRSVEFRIFYPSKNTLGPVTNSLIIR